MKDNLPRCVCVISLIGLCYLFPQKNEKWDKKKRLGKSWLAPHMYENIEYFDFVVFLRKLL